MDVGDKVLYLLMVASFTLSVGVNSITPIQPLFMVEVGATEIELGLIFAVSSLLGLALRIPLGILSDRIGRWIMIIIASVIQFISLISFSFVDSVVWFYPLMSLQSMIWAFFAPSAVSLASDMASPEKIGRIMGVYYTSIGLGQFIGPLACGILTNYMTFREIFIVLSIFPVVGLFATMSWKSRKGIKRGVERMEVPEKSERIIDSFKRIFRSRNVIGLCLSRVLFGISVAVVRTLFSVWAKTELLFTSAMISILFSVRGATNSSARIPIGRIVDKIGKKIPILIAFSLAVIAFLIFSVTTNYTVILVAMAIYGLAWGMRIVPDTTILTDNVEYRDRGLALAMLMSMFAMGNSMGSFVAGVAYTLLPMATIFQMVAGILFLGVIVLFTTIREKS